MNGPKIALLILMILADLATVAMVGKKREPITPATAVVTLVLSGVEVWLLVLA